MKKFQGGKRGGGFGGGRPSFRRDERGFDRPQLHRATCASCGDACEVPFRPNGSKPVYCRVCFKKDGDAPEARRFDRGDSRGSDRGEKPKFRATCASCGDACEVPFRPNGSKPVYCRECFGNESAPAPRRERRDDAIRVSPEPSEARFRSLEAKLDAILKLLAPSAPAQPEPAPIVEKAEPVPAKAKAAPKKKAAKKKAAAKKK